MRYKANKNSQKKYLILSYFNCNKKRRSEIKTPLKAPCFKQIQTNFKDLPKSLSSLIEQYILIMFYSW